MEIKLFWGKWIKSNVHVSGFPYIFATRRDCPSLARASSRRGDRVERGKGVVAPSFPCLPPPPSPLSRGQLKHCHRVSYRLMADDGPFSGLMKELAESRTCHPRLRVELMFISKM